MFIIYSFLRSKFLSVTVNDEYGDIRKKRLKFKHQTFHMNKKEVLLNNQLLIHQLNGPNTRL
jgi:hypothetical protein